MYNLIVARNNLNGIGLVTTEKNEIPWRHSQSDLQFFVKKTMNNIIIMGRNTWESLPTKPLRNRINIVLTSQPNSVLPYQSNGILFTFDSIVKCNNYLNNHETYCDTSRVSRWIIGGEQVYNAFMGRELINEIFITQFDSNDPCNKYFHWLSEDLAGYKLLNQTNYNRGIVSHYVKQNYEEMTLLNAMNQIVTTGHRQSNRTDIDTRVLFGKTFEYIMTEKIDEQGIVMYKLPMLTTKRMFARGIFEELKWFLQGSVDSKDLENKKINIWKDSTSREYLNKINLNEYAEGETGPIYGFQWRHWGASYVPGKKDYTAEGYYSNNTI